MKNQDQANNNINLNDPTVANDPQTLVNDLPISSEQGERVKGGPGGHEKWIELQSLSLGISPVKGLDKTSAS